MPITGESKTKFESKREPVVYSHKMPSVHPRTLGALGRQPKPDKSFNAWVTAYNPTVHQCDDTPRITASGKRVKEGFIACPRWIPFGTQVEIDGNWYECQDRMNPKYSNRFDILMWSKQEAKNWGKQYHEIEIYY